MEPSGNVVIVGAGPIGITTACTLKAVNPKINITVLDKRPEAHLNYGLSIDYHSVSKINEVLKQALINNGNPDDIHPLQSILEGWSEHFVGRNVIQMDLAKLAEKMGIQVLKNRDYEISKGDLNAYLDPNVPSLLSENQKRLRAVFQAASVIIDAEGAHSTIRSDLGIHLTEEETYKYMAELKYQTDGHTEPRGYKAASTLSSKTGLIGVEILNKRKGEEKKPVTYLVFVDAEIYNSLRQQDNAGNMKGVYGNHWTLKDLQEASKRDENLYPLYKHLDRYSQGVKERGGSCIDEKIVSLELKIYRSSESVKKIQGKYVLLIGDANSGLILQQGFNKGLKEVALCVQAVNQFFKRQSMEIIDLPEDKIPVEFTNYHQMTQELFNQERSKIRLKSAGISVAQFFAGSSASSFEAMEEIALVSSASSSNAIESSKTSKSTFPIFSTLLGWLFPSNSSQSSDNC